MSRERCYLELVLHGVEGRDPDSTLTGLNVHFASTPEGRAAYKRDEHLSVHPETTVRSLQLVWSLCHLRKWPSTGSSGFLIGLYGFSSSSSTPYSPLNSEHKIRKV